MERRAPGNKKISNNNLHGQVNQPRRPENSIFGNGSAFAPDHPHAAPNQPPTSFLGLGPEALDEIQAIIAANYNAANYNAANYNAANYNAATSNDRPGAAYEAPASLTTPSASTAADMTSVRATTMDLARVIDTIELSPGGNHLTFRNDNRRQEETLRDDQAEQPPVEDESRLLEAPWIRGEGSG